MPLIGSPWEIPLADIQVNAGQSDRSLRVFPAGSNGEFNLPSDLARVIVSGHGCDLTDSDGRHIVDFSMGWGSALVGHANEDVTEAVVRQAGLGSNFAYVTEQSLALAEELIALSPACDQVRFCASGTEATMLCIRIARAATRKAGILKFEGAYHGSNDVGVSSLFSPGAPSYPVNRPSSDGIEPGAAASVLICPFNDLEAVEQILSEHSRNLAAVIVEPLHRCLPPKRGFLEGLRALTLRHGVLLIFDEVVTGFRLAYGGAQEYYGVVPDLIAYGKALGGGYPIGAFGGSRRLMELTEEHRLGNQPYVWSASTLGGNPVSAAACNAALGIFKRPETYPFLHQIGETFREGMRSVLATHEIVGRVLGDGPLAQVVFVDDDSPIEDSKGMWRADSAKGRAVMLGLFARGIFLNPMGTKLYLSLAHRDSHLAAFMDRFDDTLSNLIG